MADAGTSGVAENRSGLFTWPFLGFIVAERHQRENDYRYPTRLRKDAANANLPFVGLWLVVSQAVKGVVD
jgi:hypothetical protein